ncbi:MAG: delta-60 repeat domain-containing protein [Candidatus Acidiferrum sp.]
MGRLSRFGTGGKTTPFIGGNSCDGSALAIQPDGKIIVGGDSYQGTSYDFTLARYNSNGTLDNSFGSGGIVTTSLSNIDGMFSALALQLDGKILAAGLKNFGSFNTDFAVVRYNSDGSLDNTFGMNGVATSRHWRR